MSVERKGAKLSHSRNVICIATSFSGQSRTLKNCVAIQKWLFGDVRHSLSPIMLEALLFLRFNERFKDDQLVAQAISNARTERAKKRPNEMEAKIEGLLLNDAVTDEQ